MQTDSAKSFETLAQTMRERDSLEGRGLYRKYGLHEPSCLMREVIIEKILVGNPPSKNVQVSELIWHFLGQPHFDLAAARSSGNLFVVPASDIGGYRFEITDGIHPLHVRFSNGRELRLFSKKIGYDFELEKAKREVKAIGDLLDVGVVNVNDYGMFEINLNK